MESGKGFKGFVGVFLEVLSPCLLGRILLLLKGFFGVKHKGRIVAVLLIDSVINLIVVAGIHPVIFRNSISGIFHLCRRNKAGDETGFIHCQSCKNQNEKHRADFQPSALLFLFSCFLLCKTAFFLGLVFDFAHNKPSLLFLRLPAEIDRHIK